MRIEPGEIETRLCDIEGVKQAVVLVKEASPGDKRLIACYTGSEDLAADALRRRLQQALPESMTPVAFVHLAKNAHLGWTDALPKARIRVIPVPGTHYSIMSPPKIGILARSLTDAIRQQAGKSISTYDNDHLVTIQAGQAGRTSIFCEPSTHHRKNIRNRFA